jgi:hypothetical protein
MWVIPDFGIWGIFLQGEKSWGAKIHTSFGIEFLRKTVTIAALTLATLGNTKIGFGRSVCVM